MVDSYDSGGFKGDKYDRLEDRVERLERRVNKLSDLGSQLQAAEVDLATAVQLVSDEVANLEQQVASQSPVALSDVNNVKAAVAALQALVPQATPQPATP